MPVSVHPSGYFVEIPENRYQLDSGKGGFTGYSNKRSRKNKFFDVAASLNVHDPIRALWTFTVPEQQTNFQDTDSHYTRLFSQLVEGLRKRKTRGQKNGLDQYLWVAESQRRGNIHYHVITNTRFMNVKYVNDYWCDVIQQKSGGCVDVQKIPPTKKVMNIALYLSKYLSKSIANHNDPYLKSGLNLKNRPIYCKSFGYSRGYPIINHVLTDKYDNLTDFAIKKFSINTGNPDIVIKGGYLHHELALDIIKDELNEQEYE